MSLSLSVIGSTPIVVSYDVLGFGGLAIVLT